MRLYKAIIDDGTKLIAFVYESEYRSNTRKMRQDCIRKYEEETGIDIINAGWGIVNIILLHRKKEKKSKNIIRSSPFLSY